MFFATEEDYCRVVETFSHYNFCFERLVLIQKDQVLALFSCLSSNGHVLFPCSQVTPQCYLAAVENDVGGKGGTYMCFMSASKLMY